MIISFAYARNRPNPKLGKVFDVRDLTHDVYSPEFKNRLADIVEYGTQHPNELIYVGCEKGKHRSPALAEQAAMILQTSVYHRNH